MPDIKHSVEIDASPEAVWPLISTPEGFTKWWAADVVTEPLGKVGVGFFNRETVFHLRSEDEDVPHLARWSVQADGEWDGTNLLFECSGDAGGCVLQFTHADWIDETDYFISCNTTWGELMYRLKAAAEGKPRGPLFLAATVAY